MTDETTTPGESADGASDPRELFVILGRNGGLVRAELSEEHAKFVCGDPNEGPYFHYTRYVPSPSAPKGADSQALGQLSSCLVDVARELTGSSAVMVEQASEQLLAISAERDEAAERLADYHDDYRAVIEEKCAGDEVHCSCVPHLRARIAALEAERDAETTRADAYERSHIEIRKALGGSEHDAHEWVLAALEARDRLIADLVANAAKRKAAAESSAVVAAVHDAEREYEEIVARAFLYPHS